MMQMLVKLQGSKRMFKNNHAVGTVDKALVYIIIIVKLIFLVIFNKILKTHLVKLYCYL